MLPIGIIALWQGSIATIPAGWQICDGTNGTPDLRDRFILGAGDTYNPGDTGGATTHNHSFTTDGHTHDLIGGVEVGTGTGVSDVTSSSVDTGTTNTINHLPPYYALAYIMRI